MFFEPKAITLKDGRSAVLRSPEPDDAEEMLEFLRMASSETDFLLRSTEDEITMTVEGERNYLERAAGSPDNLMICCFVGEDEASRVLAGNCALSFNSRRKTAHRASIGIALKKEFWGLGIGTNLMRELDLAARERGVSQLELEFIEGNNRARALYEKSGFRIVGVHPNAFRMSDGSLANEYLMIKELK
ncbi:MAG: GNAT family N-acetyltransferase [Candidatus Flemingiibacterium sp.]